jgi:hypothetical protein
MYAPSPERACLPDSVCNETWGCSERISLRFIQSRTNISDQVPISNADNIPMFWMAWPEGTASLKGIQTWPLWSGNQNPLNPGTQGDPEPRRVVFCCE